MIEFTDEEVMALLKSQHQEHTADVITQIIMYLRSKKDTDPSAINFLDDMLQLGNIPISTYQKMRDAVENPDAEFTVVQQEL
jgi:hypothetical protein